MTPKANDSERMRELGRASGRARRERRKPSFLDVLTSHVNERPEELVGALMASPAGAVVIARLAEKAGALERAQAPATDSVPSPAESAAGGFSDLILTAIEAGAEVAVLGFELSDAPVSYTHLTLPTKRIV